MNTATLNREQPGSQPREGYELKITRVFHAPRELLWQAWTDPAMQMQWMGPRGFKTTELNMPKTPGAPWRRTMEGWVPATHEFVQLRQHGTVLEVRPPQLLVFSLAWDDPGNLGLSDLDIQETTVTVKLEAEGKKTVMTFTQGPFLSASARDGHMGGWNSSFDKLMDLMAAEEPPGVPAAEGAVTELHLRRFFNAPRELVFSAWTTPAMLAEWWAPKGFTNPRCDFEARAGGKIYIEMRPPDGTLYSMSGRVRDFYPPYRFVFLSTPLNQDGGAIFELWNSVYLEEKDSGTEVFLDVHVVRMTDVAPMYLKGMHEGWSQSLEKLAVLLLEQLKRN